MPVLKVTLETDMSHVTQNYWSSGVWPIHPMCLVWLTYWMCLVYGSYTECVWCMDEPYWMCLVYGSYTQCVSYGSYTECVWCMAHILNVYGVWLIHLNVSGAWLIHPMCLVHGSYIQCVWCMAHTPNVYELLRSKAQHPWLGTNIEVKHWSSFIFTSELCDEKFLIPP